MRPTLKLQRIFHIFPMKKALLEQVKQDFHRFPEAIKQTQVIAKLCEIKKTHFPTVFPSFKNMGENSVAKELWSRCLHGVELRYNKASCEMLKKVQERLDHEFEVIREKGFCSYFLVVADIVRRSKINCGRGSGASSLVCYLLGITHVDPIEHNLYLHYFFGEFL